MIENSPRKTVDKAMRILQAFSAAQPELSVGELSERLGMHKSVVSRLAAALHDWGMIEKDSRTRKLRIGEGAFRVGSLFLERNNLVRIATPHMEKLVAATGQSSHLSILEGLRFLVVATIESPSALRVIMRIGERRPLHSTAAGKLFLANSDVLLDAVLTGKLESFTSQTLTSPAKLRKVVATAKKKEIAWNAGESSIGAGAVAAPIHDRSGRMIAALSTVYPLGVVDGRLRTRVGAVTSAAARHISLELGYRPKPQPRSNQDRGATTTAHRLYPPRKLPAKAAEREQDG
jgi:DNA-binding IclR family transcriptional regulator